MSQSIAPAGGVRAWIREIATLVARAECYLLEIGELDSAIRAVNEVLTRDAAVPGWTGAAAHAGG